MRDRTAFITFDSPSAASAAVAKTGARLHDRELTVALANEAGGGAAAPLSSLGSSRDEQLAVLGIDAGRSTGRGSVGKAMRGVVYSNDHSPGFLKHKQGVDAGGFVPGISRGAHQSTGALRPPLYAPLPLPGHRAPRPRTRAPTTVSLSRAHTHTQAGAGPPCPTARGSRLASSRPSATGNARGAPTGTGRAARIATSAGCRSEGKTK